MACQSCGNCGIKSGNIQFSNGIKMEQVLTSNGFVYGGTCGSCTGNMRFFTKAGFNDKRIKLGTGGYWVQVKTNRFNWSTVDFGNAQTLHEKITKWFI